MNFNINNIEFSECTANDIEDVYSIELSGLNPWKKKFFFDELEINISTFKLAKYNNIIIGFIIAWDLKGDIQINNIAVKKEYKNLKIATKLLELIIDYYNGIKPERIFIEVNEKNSIAIKFYLKNGFIETGIRKNYYNNNDNAVLMENKLI